MSGRDGFIHGLSALVAGAELALPAGAARHVQVLRMQPGDRLTLFDGTGGEWQAAVTRMGRGEVRVRLEEHTAIEREAARAVHLAVGLIAVDRMDWLVEKATELGAASLRPLLTEHTSLRLAGERAEKKRAHWRAVAVASCEQNGRNRLLEVRQQLSFHEHVRQPISAGEVRWLLSLDRAATPLSQALAALAPSQTVALLSGPEGGLSAAEETAAQAAGYRPVGLGRRVLRAETAPLAALAVLTLP
jgi:16S rRNA (uracil1498-N3)-methyltransferase